MITITNEQKVLINVSGLTEAGSPTILTVVPVWTVTSGDVTLNVAEDGLSAEVISGGTESTSLITVNAKINDVLDLTNAFEVCVIFAEPIGLSFTAEEPTLILEAPVEVEILVVP